MFNRKILAKVVFFLTDRLSLRSFIYLARLYSLAYYNFNIKSKSIVKENMKKIHLKFSIKQYLNFAQFLSENIYLYNNEIDLSRFVFHNLNLLDSALRLKNPVFLISVHYGNWELSGQALVKLGYRMTVMYEKKNDWIYEYIDSIRVKYGLKLMTREISLEGIEDEAKSGRIIVFLIDHKSENIALRQMNFLGMETELPYGWFRLIKKLKASPVCVLTRYERRKHNLYFFSGTGLDFADYYKKFEKMIKKDIFQYDFYNQMWKDIAR
ncbi:MAG: lysophospholipid acyltransferase family protein [bacterium]|nr:lysophospholipid acyltransferase family protein [bacterium]